MRQIILDRKYYFYSVIYFLVVALAHWRLNPNLETVVFGIGGLIGLHLLDATELALDMRPTEIRPSPFRNLLTQLVLFILGVFVITSSPTNIGSGIVLFLLLRILLLQRDDYQSQGHLSQWLPDLSVASHKAFLNIEGVIFIVISLLFILI